MSAATDKQAPVAAESPSNAPSAADIAALAELVASFRMAVIPTSTRVLSDACLNEINRVVMVFTAQFR